MKKQILTLAIIAALPLTAMAENISGAMYVAPTYATQNNPAPTTDNIGPYGRINIDTADQQNIASTAYVKGAYNSAIAAVNRAITFGAQNHQSRLFNDDTQNNMESEVLGSETFIVSIDNNDDDMEEFLVSAQAVVAGINHIVNNKRVEIYTTWDNDNAKKQVEFVNAPVN